MKGFTAIEILLVVAISVILFALVFPLGINFYRDWQLQNCAQQILQTLRKAQGKAMASELDSSFGIYIQEGSYVLFKGDSFENRDNQFDEIFNLPLLIVVDSLPKEVVFSKLRGEPKTEEEITINSGSQREIIKINEAGRINLEM